MIGPVSSCIIVVNDMNRVGGWVAKREKKSAILTTEMKAKALADWVRGCRKIFSGVLLVKIFRFSKSRMSDKYLVCEKNATTH